MHAASADTSPRSSSLTVGPLALVGFILFFLLSACESDMTEPPSGWESADGHWWHAEVDTAMAFRSMETLEDMGLDETEAASEAAAQRQDATDRSMQEIQFAHNIKERLLPLFRNNPDVVDSLFQADVYPAIQELDMSGDLAEDLQVFEQDAYSMLRDNFQEPATRLRLGDDVQVVYPDSLRQADIGGRVQTQVYLNEDGEPLAVKLVESVHPTLDRIGMYAATQMRWNPARINRDGEWEDIPSWSRFTVNFATR